MIPIKPTSSWKGTADCKNCSIRSSALFADLTEEDFSLISAPIDSLSQAAGTSLVQEGQIAKWIFTVRSGSLKLIRNTSDGRQRIVRIMRPGDVIGLEALGSDHYTTDAVALSDVSLCRIPVGIIQNLAINSPRLHQSLMRKWHQIQKETDDWLTDLNFGSATRRLSNFLLKMHDPLTADLVTVYSREDMGAMLDLKLETVSREISAMVKSNVLQPADKRGRVYRIVNFQALRAD